MAKRAFFILILFAGALTACEGLFKNHKHVGVENMDTTLIKNKTVKDAIEAFQSGDSEKWLSLFSDHVVLSDDGHPRNFRKFSAEAIKTERFTGIDKIENDGTAVFGPFHSDTWGDFKAYFKFHLNSQGKINRLEIGQATY
jgi:hypothetical protein